jgi:uncharacterized protein YlxW (UPF0749 family)
MPEPDAADTTPADDRDEVAAAVLPDGPDAPPDDVAGELDDDEVLPPVGETEATVGNTTHVEEESPPPDEHPDPESRPIDPLTTARSPAARLRAALAGSPSGAKILIAALVALLGFAAVTQVRISSEDDFQGERRQDLVVILDSLTQSIDRVRDQIEDLERDQSTLISRRSQRATDLRNAKAKLATLSILAGTARAQGPGVRITITASAGTISASILLDAIEELRDAGAEAMEINDKVRVVASTAITESSGVVYAGGTALKLPFVIDAIGSAHTLQQAVTFRGGLTEQVENNGGKVNVQTSDAIKVSSLHNVKSPQYSQPAD